MVSTLFFRMKTIGCNTKRSFDSFELKISLVCLNFARLKHHASKYESLSRTHSDQYTLQVINLANETWE